MFKAIKLTYRELYAEKRGEHQNSEASMYVVYPVGRNHDMSPEFRTYAEGIRDAKQQALKHFNKE